jgi:hypothetical protein
MKTMLAVLAVAVAAWAAPAAAGPFGRPGFQIQAPHQKPRPERFERGGPGREVGPRHPPERPQRGRLTEEERRELHRDLDKANRELYRRRHER